MIAMYKEIQDESEAIGIKKKLNKFIMLNSRLDYKELQKSRGLI